MGSPRKRWDTVDWSKTDAEIAHALGTSRQNVAFARKNRNAPPSPAGWGGSRPGSGRPPKPKRQGRAAAPLRASP
jgi:hypothetical protein